MSLLAQAVARGASVDALAEDDDDPDLCALSAALNRLAAATAAREQQLLTERPPDFQLALEELAREQAAELSLQNAELRRQNKELQRANQLKGDFLATMSHELRTPLNAVMGYSELLLEQIPGPLNDEQKDYVRIVQRAGENLLGMINDILDLAKIDAGRMEFHCTDFDLREPVVEAERIAQSLARKKKQVLWVDAPREVPVKGDVGRLRQIALNLMSNAVKFTPEGGQITVRVFEGSDGPCFVVEDTGIGIHPSNHGLVFEAFRQIDGSESRGYPGTGLGLALVKKFAEGMGGRVGLRSALGEGSAFSVTLPTPGADGRQNLRCA